MKFYKSTTRRTPKERRQKCRKNASAKPEHSIFYL